MKSDENQPKTEKDSDVAKTAANLSARHGERVLLLRDELKDLYDDLRASGLEFESVSEIRSIEHRHRYRAAIPILLSHLKRPYFDDALGVIAWLLCEKLPEIKRAWPVLVDSYRAAPQGEGIAIRGDSSVAPFHAKDHLANAVAASFTPERLQQLSELLRDQSNGKSRILLMQPLRRRKEPEVQKLLVELSRDPDLMLELSTWKRFETTKGTRHG